MSDAVQKRRVYLNPKQMEFVQHNAKIGVFLGGRGVGKSSIAAAKQRRRIKELPRALTFLSSTTYGQILTKTIPALIEMWERMGIYENIHYVIGKKPPEGWKLPYSNPKSYKHVISFRWGNAMALLSMDRPDLGRGGSYQGGDLDEAALVPEEHFKRVILPSLRGSRTRFRNIPMYRQTNLYTSVPWKSKGRWILEYKEKALKDPKTYHFTETTSLDNLAVLGQDYIDLMRKELSPIEFAREIMNEVFNKAELQFYHEFDEDRHPQSATYDYNDTDEGIEVAGVAEYWPNQLIELSFDFGGWFTGLLAFQSDMIYGQPWEYMIDAMGVTEGQNLITILIDNFCQAYQNHGYKLVLIWGEPRGHDKQVVDNSHYETIQEAFAKNGWRSVVKVRAVRTGLHVPRHEFMNRCLAEKDWGYPRLRCIQEKTQDAITSVMLTEIRPDGRKNKNNEKDRDYPQQWAPHYSDMLDYYIFYKYSPLVGGLMSAAGGGFADADVV